MPQRTIEFGAIAGILEGKIFENRREVYAAKLHRTLLSGISGRAEAGCDAIIVSGGYEDDDDRAETIIYTGEGGRDPRTKQQIANQLLVKGNLALHNSMTLELPVRVVRGATTGSKYGPENGYRYDGLYDVVKAWQEKGRSGFIVWRFELRKMEELQSNHSRQ